MWRPGIALSLVLLVAAAPASPAPAPARGAEVSGGGVEKTFEGRVTEFLAGRSLTVELDDRSVRTIPLDERGVETTLPPGLAAGSRVRVVASRSVDGKRSVSVTLLPSTHRKP